MRWKDVSPAEANDLLATDPNLLVLDVRTPPEYESHHIDGANLIPVQVIDQYFQQLDPQRTWVVVCEHGVRSEAACEFLAQQGFGNLLNVQGGMAAWVGASLPVSSGFPAPAPREAAAEGGGCGHHCGCANKQQDTAKQQAAAEPAQAATQGKEEKKGWLRSLFGR